MLMATVNAWRYPPKYACEKTTWRVAV